MVVTFGAMMITIIPFVGTQTFFVMLPFSAITLMLLFLSIVLNYQSGKLYENIKIWPDLIEVKRYEINGTNIGQVIFSDLKITIRSCFEAVVLIEAVIQGCKIVGSG